MFPLSGDSRNRQCDAFHEFPQQGILVGVVMIDRAAAENDWVGHVFQAHRGETTTAEFRTPTA